MAIKGNLLVSQELVVCDSSCDSLYHMHHRTASDPTTASSTSFTQNLEPGNQITRAAVTTMYWGCIVRWALIFGRIKLTGTII